MNNSFNFYCIIVKINNKFFPIQIEFYNPFTCFLYDNELISIFKTFKQANKYKNEILNWKINNRLHKDFNFEYITVAKINEIQYYNKNKIGGDINVEKY